MLLLIFVAELAAIVVVPDAKGELVAAGKSVGEAKTLGILVRSRKDAALKEDASLA